MQWLRRWFGLDAPDARDERSGESDQFADEHERILREQRRRLQMLQADADLVSRRYPKGEQ